MWLKLIPSGLGMSSRTTFGEKAETAHTLHFTLHLAGQDRLTLETGEVLQNPRYAAVRGDKQNEIDAQMNVRPASEGRDLSHTNRMGYFAGVSGDDDGAPPSIHFDVTIPASDYSLLLKNIRGGINPASVTVELRHDLFGKGSPLEYDFAPDGSMMRWRNATKENRFVAVEGIDFQYRLIGADDDDDAVAAPATATASIDAASAAIVGKLADLEKAFRVGQDHNRDGDRCRLRSFVLRAAMTGGAKRELKCKPIDKKYSRLSRRSR